MKVMASRTVPVDVSCAVGASTHEIVTVGVAAAKAIAAAKRVAETELLPLLAAAGRVASATVASSMDLPPFNNSAMDGYAVAFADLVGEGPWMLHVSQRVAAGSAPSRVAGSAQAVGSGRAARIFTGAPVPEGLDTVVMQEHCERTDDGVVIRKRPRHGENVRRAGEDVRRGTSLVESGDVLSSQGLALLAGAGIAEVTAFRKVRITLVSTGMELREPGTALEPGQIYNTNRILLRSMLAVHPWVEIDDVGIVPDDRDRLTQVLLEAAAGSDVIVTTGGVSAGEEDHLAAILREGGAALHVLKVAMRPGKPVKVGVIGRTLLAALPGNPSAALVTFRQIALPAIRAVAGMRDVHPEWQPALSGFSYAKKLGRTEFMPVRIAGRSSAGVPVLEMLGRGSSAGLSAMALADGIALLPPELEAIEPRSPLRFEFLR